MDKHKLSQLKKLALEKDFSGHILIKDKEDTFEYLQGYENTFLKTPISKDSIFPIASGTKFLTALAIGQFIDQEILSLDTYVHDIYDLGIPTYTKDIQIKHLLSHTSGLPDYLSFAEQGLIKIDNKALKQVKDYITYFPHHDMRFVPGSKFEYNDQAFVYLALIVECITKMSYQTYINQYILEPLHISHSGIFTTSSQFKHKVMGYIDSKREITHEDEIPEMPGGDGGAYMNAYDFYSIIQAFLSGKIISEPLMKLFMMPHIRVDEAHDIYYGYGLWLKKCGQTYIPYVVGYDPGIRFQSIFTKDSFYWIVSNTNDDIWDMILVIEELGFHF